MHATACQLLLLLAGQTYPAQLAPVDNVQLQPAPMSVDLNTPTESPALRCACKKTDSFRTRDTDRRAHQFVRGTKAKSYATRRADE